EALNRAHERIEQAEIVSEQASHVDAAMDAYEAAARSPYLERIPVRQRDEIVLVPVATVASVVAEGELLHITTLQKARYTITYRLKDLEQRLDPARFMKLGRGTLANVDAIVKVGAMPGGTHEATLRNGQKLQVSRIQSRILRQRLLKL
ncbi:MAG TPA: LytTR family DNA-binding domain-containing protein, partial [Vicinamibacterales bacterium]